jgi:hypothetical protein
VRQTLKDFGYNLSKVPLLCDNESALRMVDNPINNCHTKHLDILYHFLRYHSQKVDIVIDHISSNKQPVDIFIKHLFEKRFCELSNELNIFSKHGLKCYIPCLFLCL